MFSNWKIDILYGNYKEQRKTKEPENSGISCPRLTEWSMTYNNLSPFQPRFINYVCNYKGGGLFFLLSKQSSCIGILCSSNDMTPCGLEVEKHNKKCGEL